MTSKAATFKVAASGLVEERIERLREMSFAEACALPEVAGEDVLIGGFKASVTTFRYADAIGLAGKVLVVVLAARPLAFGMAAQHVERGLVFAPSEPVREASVTELQNSGG
jgi:hypothetical protein